MTRRTERERSEIDVFYAQEIFPQRNTRFGTSDPDKLSWEKQVDLGRERFPSLQPPFNYYDLMAAYQRRKNRAKQSINMV